MEAKARATVEIFGEEYIMRGDTTPEYMRMLANYIDKKMKHIATRQPQLSMTKIAVLAALNIADELSKLQEDYDALVKMMDGEKKDEKKNDEKKNDEKKNDEKKNDEKKNDPKKYDQKKSDLTKYEEKKTEKKQA